MIHALRASGQGAAHNGAEILRVFDAVQNNQKASSAVRITRLQQILKTGRG